MPTRLATVADATVIITLINQTYNRLRAANALPDGVSNWTAAEVRGFLAAGYVPVVWENPLRPARRIDAMAWVGDENYVRTPDTDPKPWLAIKILALRMAALPTTASRERTMGALLKGIVRPAAARGLTGIVCDVPKDWTDLLAYLATWSQNTFDPAGPHSVRAWLRFQNAATPEFEARMAAEGVPD